MRALTEMVKRTHPVVVEELTPALLSLGQVQRVLQALLDEGVPIRDLVRIFEALSLRAKISTDHDGLVEAARAALGPAIAAQYADAAARLAVLTLDPHAGARPAGVAAARARPARSWPSTAMRAEAIVGDVARLVEAAEQQGITAGAGLLAAAAAAADRLLRAGARRVPVLSYTEIAGLPPRRSRPWGW